MNESSNNPAADRSSIVEALTSTLHQPSFLRVMLYLAATVVQSGPSQWWRLGRYRRGHLLRSPELGVQAGVPLPRGSLFTRVRGR